MGAKSVVVTVNAGAGAQGLAEFRLSTPVTDQSTGAVYGLRPVIAGFNAQGACARSLVCNDDPAVTPQGTTWAISTNVNDVQYPAFDYNVSIYTPGLAENLANMTPVTGGVSSGGGNVGPTPPPPTGALLSGNNLADVQSSAASRMNLGLGTAATSDAGTFDLAGAGTLAAAGKYAKPGTGIPRTDLDAGTQASLAHADSLTGGGATALIPTPVKTAAYTAVVGQRVICNATAGAFPVTLPAAAIGAEVGIVNVAAAGTNAVTVTPAGTDSILGAALSIAPGSAVDLMCLVAGAWSSLTSGGGGAAANTATLASIDAAPQFVLESSGLYPPRPIIVPPSIAVLYIGADDPTASTAANSGAPALATDLWIPLGFAVAAPVGGGGGLAPSFTAASPPTTALTGQVYPTYTFTATLGATFTVGSGALPPGLTLSAAGVLSGTPTAAAAYTFTVWAGNGSGNTTTPSLTITTRVPGPAPCNLGVAMPTLWPGTSIFTALPSNPTVDTNSAALVTAWHNNMTASSNNVGLNGYTFTPTRYEVRSSVTPLVPVTITGDYGYGAGTVQVPIPVGAVPDIGSYDHPMVVWDLDTSTVWEMYKMNPYDATAGWVCEIMGYGSTSSGNGVFTRSGGTHGTNAASGISYLGCQITARDLQAGVISHALGCALPYTANGFVAPALYHDGNNVDPAKAIPEGTRFFFPSVANGGPAAPAGLSPLQQMVFVALQNYGMYLIDTAGAVTIYGENQGSWLAAGLTNPWTGKVSTFYSAFTALPWTQLAVMAHP